MTQSPLPPFQLPTATARAGTVLTGKPPWSVFLMVNVAQQPLVRAEMWVHQYPDVVVCLRNQQSQSAAGPNANQWVVVMQIDRFQQRTKALEFYERWRMRIRRLDRYIAKGYYIYQKHIDEYPGTFIVISPYTCQEWRAHFAAEAVTQPHHKFTTSTLDLAQLSVNARPPQHQIPVTTVLAVELYPLQIESLALYPFPQLLESQR